MKKKLDSYRGKLDAAQIAEGMNAASENAKRLLTDAETLLAANAFPSATSLAILSIEEAGKVSILRMLALSDTDKEIDEIWKDYRSHTKKNAFWLLPQLAVQGARKLDDLRPLFDKESDHPFVLDQLKQLGFYTDCLGTCHWSKPAEVIDEQLSKMLVSTARILVRESTHTEKEIALWIEHVGPVWKKDPSWMKQAVINWYGAMQSAGLVEAGENKMEQFIYHDVQG